MGLTACCTYHPLPPGGSGACVTTRLRATARADATSACAWPSRSRVSIWRTYSQPATGRARVHRATSRSLRRRVMELLGNGDQGMGNGTSQPWHQFFGNARRSLFPDPRSPPLSRTPAIADAVHRLDRIELRRHRDELLADALDVRGDGGVVHYKLGLAHQLRSEEHTSELQSPYVIS